MKFVQYILAGMFFFLLVLLPSVSMPDLLHPAQTGKTVVILYALAGSAGLWTLQLLLERQKTKTQADFPGFSACL